MSTEQPREPVTVSVEREALYRALLSLDETVRCAEAKYNQLRASVESPQRREADFYARHEMERLMRVITHARESAREIRQTLDGVAA